MALSEVFSFSSLVTLAIVCILLASTSFLVYTRLQQQTAKINAVVDLVSSVVGDVTQLKSALGNRGGKFPEPPFDVSQHHPLTEIEKTDILPSLIEVSDTEECDDNDVDYDNEDDEEEEEDSEDGEEEEEDSEDGEEEEEDSEDGEEEEEEEEEEDDEQPSELHIESDDLDKIDIDIPDTFDLKEHDVLDTSKVIELDVNIEPNEITEPPVTSISSSSKIINISEGDTTIDYGKLSVGELKKIAVERGLISGSDKVKKTKLIEMLSE